eukprot:TRINITY_DN30236_c0_g1_i1.p1 TRINITY_DN30236_c0_g1~~TRINITY_DN30236_c0_g1_i1.p1  ORF type:complete len:504 (+),score=105.18 TRINITY_DN30236_c0_g1_i1:63-1514(+)
MEYTPLVPLTNSRGFGMSRELRSTDFVQPEPREERRKRRLGTSTQPRIQQWANPEIGFARLVDEISEEALQEENMMVSSRTYVRDWTETMAFNYTVGAMVVANAGLLGVIANYGNTIWLNRLSDFFLFCFVIELSLRVRFGGTKIFLSPWALFDLILVILGVLDALVLPAFAANNDFVSELISTLRVCRIFRVLRLFEIFERLNILWHAFLKALESTLSVSVLVAILNYACAVVMTIMVGNKTQEFEEDADKVWHWFGTVFKSMQTLFIVMTLAEWDEIITTLQAHCAPWKHPIIFMFFAVYIVVGAYALMSMITGIICEALTAAERQRERELEVQNEHARLVSRKEFAKNVIRCLQRLDLNGDSKISRSEVEEALSNDPAVIDSLHALDIDLTQQELLELIRRMSVMEANGEEVVALKEVAGVVTNLTGPASAYSVIDLQYRQTRMNQRFDHVYHELKQLSSGMRQLTASVEKLTSSGARKR